MLFKPSMCETEHVKLPQEAPIGSLVCDVMAAEGQTGNHGFKELSETC